MIELSWQSILIASVVYFFAETYAVVIGGGGSFLIQPVLILLGLPPKIAVANDIAAGFGTASGGALVFFREKKMRIEILKWMLVPTLIGGYLGSQAMVSLLDFWVKKLIGIFAICLVILLPFLRKNYGLIAGRLPRFWQPIAMLIGFGLGFHMGFSSAGTGMLAAFCFLVIFRTTITQSMALKKVILGAPALIAIFNYFLLGYLDLRLLLPMFLAGMAAGFVGSKIALRAGDLWLRRIFTVAVIFFAVILIFQK